MPKYDLVLFDMDGTTANTDLMIVETFRRLYKKFKAPKDRSDNEIISLFSGPPIRKSLVAEFPDCKLEEIYPVYKEISTSLYRDFIKPFHGVRETIINLINNDVNVGIITNKNSNNAHLTLEIVHLEDVVSYCLGSNDVEFTKPDPCSANMAMEHFNIKDKSKVLYVGDNSIDYVFAKNSGIDCALLNWLPRKFTEDTNPKYWVKDFDDLYKVVMG